MQTIDRTYPTARIDVPADLISAVKAQVSQMRSAASPLELNNVSCELVCQYLEALFDELATAVKAVVEKAGMTVGPVVLESCRIPMIDGDYDGNYRTNAFDQLFADRTGGAELGDVVLQFLLWDKRPGNGGNDITGTSTYFQLVWPSPTMLEVAFCVALMTGLSTDHHHRYIEDPNFLGFDSNGLAVIDIFLGS